MSAINPARLLFLLLLCAAGQLKAADSDLAANATNQLAVDLYRQLASGDKNLCLSPYSIESALAMTFAGADGETRSEMARVLHFPNGGDETHASFAALQGSLAEMAETTALNAAEPKKQSEPITIAIANRLFAQSGYDFRNSFRELVKKFYGAPFEPLDFKRNPDRERQHINKWVAEQTHDRIRDLIPAGALNELTRLVLANAIYLKAPWSGPFSPSATKPQAFHLSGKPMADVPTMREESHHFGYAKRDGFAAVSLPYLGNDLQFLVLVPDEIDGLRTLESKLTPELLAQCAKLELHDVDLSLPKFKFEPATITLAGKLQALGMKTAFDIPRGSANFDNIAPRTFGSRTDSSRSETDDYLAISDVFHKTFIAVDEKGTEAAAATAVAMVTAAMISGTPRRIEVKVDRPFVYAIQHVPSGACLFFGRVTDPR